MSTFPIAGGVSSPLTTQSDQLDVGALPTSARSDVSSLIGLDFLQVTRSSLGISAPGASGGDVSVLVDEVLAENEKLRLNSEGVRGQSLSARIRSVVGASAASVAHLNALEAQVSALETNRDTLLTQRDGLQESLNGKKQDLSALEIEISAKQSLISTQETLIQQIGAALTELDDPETSLTARQALQEKIDTLGTRLAQLQVQLAGLVEMTAPDARQSLQAISTAVGGLLAQLQTSLAALGSGGDPAVRKSLEAQIGVLSALHPEVQASLADLEPDAEAGAAQTLNGFSAAISKASSKLASDIDALASSQAEETPEIQAAVAALRAQISALGILGAQVDARRETLSGRGETAGENADPGAAEGLRLIASVLLGSVSAIEGQIAASGQREHSPERTLARSIVSLNESIASLQAELASLGEGLEEGASQDQIDAYSSDIAALQELVAALQARKSALPDTSALSTAEALAAEIAALTSVDADLLKREGDTSQSGRVKTIVDGVSELFDASILQLAQDNRDLENGALLAIRDATLLGQTSVASALGNLVVPLENQIYAFSDNTQATERPVIAGQIDTLTAEIASLQSQFDDLDPTDDAAARALLESQLNAAVSLKSSATTQLNTLNTKRAPINTQITSLNGQIASVDAAINQVNAQIAVKQDEFNNYLQQNPQMLATAVDAAQVHGTIRSAVFSAGQEDSIIDELLTDLRKAQLAAGAPTIWTKAPEGNASESLEGGAKRTPKALPIQSLALSVVAVQEALGLLRAGTPDQADPKRIKLSM